MESKYRSQLQQFGLPLAAAAAEERARLLSAAGVRVDGKFGLYWAHHALRVAERSSDTVTLASFLARAIEDSDPAPRVQAALSAWRLDAPLRAALLETALQRCSCTGLLPPRDTAAVLVAGPMVGRAVAAIASKGG
jgi:hypothetical protein